MINKSSVKLAIKVLFLGTFFIFIFGKTIFAKDVAAKSCSAADIQSAIDTCISHGGGTVTIPACSEGSNGSTWSNGQNVCVNATQEIRILGAGKDATVIKYANGAKPSSKTRCGAPSPHMFEIKGNQFKELGNLTLSGSDDLGASIIWLRACDMTDVRIHHVAVKKIYRGMYICQNLNSALLIDHCYVGDKFYSYAYGINIIGNNNELYWNEPITTMGSNVGVFIEDSEFNGTYHPIAGSGSARYTARHNKFSNFSSALEAHGPSYQHGCLYSCPDPGKDAQCFQGAYRVEVYDNHFTGGTWQTYTRGGHWIITDNTFDNALGNPGPVHIELESRSIGSTCSSANGCPKATGWAGVGACAPAGGDTGCWESPHAVYVWNNIYKNSANPKCVTGRDDLCTSINSKGTGCPRINDEVFFRAPQAGDPEIRSYSKFPYPHPLASGGRM